MSTANTSKEQVVKFLIEHYRDLLVKNHKYQMGDDDYQLTTAENDIVRPLITIIKDLEKK